MKDKKIKISSELQEIFEDIKKFTYQEFPTNIITYEHFIRTVFYKEESVAFKSIYNIMFNNDMNDLLSKIIDDLENMRGDINPNINIIEDLEIYKSTAENIMNQTHSEYMNSGHFLCAIFNKTPSLSKLFKKYKISYRILFKSVEIETRILEKDFVKSEKKKHKKEKNTSYNDEEVNMNYILNRIKTNSEVNEEEYNDDNDEVIKNLTNINDKAKDGKIIKYIGNNNIYNKIFSIFNKKYKNNIIITGEHGVGKTTLINNLANLLVENKVPIDFKGMKLMKFDLSTLVIGTAFKGSLEMKLDTIINDAKKSYKYIFYIDNIANIIGDKTQYSDTDTEIFLNKILEERNIPVIIECDIKTYISKIKNNKKYSNLQNIELKEPNENECIDIIDFHKKIIEDFHNVTFYKDVSKDIIGLSKRYLSEYNLPDIAIDIIDETASLVALNQCSNSKIEGLEKEYKKIEDDIKDYKKNKPNNFEEIDNLEKLKIEVNTNLEELKKDLLLNKKTINISEDDIKNIISNKSGIPINNLNSDDKSELKDLNKKLKEIVIGQDEAIDSVCRVVRRQRVGLNNSNKPSVLFFGGSTGTGKSYLAKKLAEKVFGDEKYMVRLDMSEYSDKMSTNKLYGSAPGYVGYEEGGTLTNAIKKNKYCVLLLDEIEKASEEVHNVFLQLFDDGRITDNKGTTIDFKNVIIIMTSNVGARKIDDKQKHIGFNQIDNNVLNKEIIKSELKKAFKPEFINRIDEIVYFNKLNKDNLKEIILLEIKKINHKINKIGYSLSNDFYSNEYIDTIYNMIDKNENYGARPIIRIVEKNIEDKIVDYIIDNDIKKGFIFKPEFLL